MAIYETPKTIKSWFFNNQPVTWFIHGLVTEAISWVAFLATGSFLWKAVIATSFAAGFFLPKEQKDEKDHKAKQDWYKRDYMGITPMIDKYGDLGMPCMVAFINWTNYLAHLI